MSDSLRRLFCIGETMAVVASADGLPIASGRTFRIGVGGAESNVAAHLAAMGHPTVWLSRLGDDPLGDRVLRVLEDTGIDTSRVVRDANGRTGVYFKEAVSPSASAVFYYRAGSAASRMSLKDLDSWPLEAGDWVHVSGITAALSSSCNELVEAILDRAHRVGYLVSFDVNYRAGLWPIASASARLLELASLSHVVLVGLDEAQVLWGIDTSEDVAALLPEAAHLIVKDGANEAVEFERDEKGIETIQRVKAHVVDVVEPIGAGDAFAAGYLHALMARRPSSERLERGHELAAWTLGSHHDFRPLHSNGVSHGD